ncbi:MAG: hypothetical protein JW912_00190 [Sedimentisphaerales bacterium]|nr:hypothetical protein [Sedimentisphaerales bacterium]
MLPSIRKKSIFVLMTIIISVMAIPSIAIAEDNIWADDEDAAKPGQPDFQQMTDEMLERIAQENPEKAKQLRELRDQDPEKFKEQMHREAAQSFGRNRGGQNESMRRGRAGGQPQTPGEGFGHAERNNGEGPGRMSRWKDRVQKKHDEFVDWLKENYTDVADELAKLRETDPGEYIKKFTESREKYGEIMEVQKRNPEYAEVLKEDLELKQNRDTLIRKLQNADDEQKDEIKDELKEIVAKRFDIIIKKKEFKYKALKERLEDLQKKLDSRQAELNKLVQSKDQAIDGRMKELIGESEELNWD